MTLSPEAAVARRSLLDALEALSSQLDALVLVGAQAVYLHTGDSDVAIASHTVDADLAVVPERLHDDPRLEDVMRSAGFLNDLSIHQPGAWISRDDVPVELLVPEQLHAGGGRRGARIPPHAKRAVLDRRRMGGRAPEPRRRSTPARTSSAAGDTRDACSRAASRGPFRRRHPATSG
jgi:hypothetical protein